MGISHRPAKYGSKRGKRKGADAENGFILTVVDGLNPGKEYFFDQNVTVGRVENNDIVLVEPGISRNHARVLDDYGVYMLEDLGSANGTRLNGEGLTGNEVLRDGDYITLSQTTLQFSQLNSPRGEITTQTPMSELEAKAADDPKRAHDTPLGSVLKAKLRTRQGKLLVGLLLAVVLLGGGGSAVYFGLLKGKEGIIFDQSNTPLAYSDDDTFFNAVYGYGKYDRTRKNKVIIDFEYMGGRATLQYGAWGVDKVGEVALMLNGKKVGQVPLTRQRWVYGLKQLLPKAKLNKGKNRLVFNNIRNPPGEDSWELCYIQVVQEAIPPADPKEARYQFELAKKSWEDRQLDPGNMYTSLIGFKKARDLLEAMSEQPELYLEAEDFMNKVDKALTKKFNDGLFSGRRAEKMGDPEKARLFLLQTRRFFRKDDFRFREIQRRLDGLAGL